MDGPGKRELPTWDLGLAKVQHIGSLNARGQGRVAGLDARGDAGQAVCDSLRIVLFLLLAFLLFLTLLLLLALQVSPVLGLVNLPGSSRAQPRQVESGKRWVMRSGDCTCRHGAEDQNGLE